MINKLILTVDLPPSVNSYMKYKVASNRGKRYVQAYKSEETVKFEKETIPYIQEQIKIQGWEQPNNKALLYVDCTIFMNKKRKDADNLLKVLLDCMTKAKVYFDDSIAMPRVNRIYIDQNRPRIKIEVYDPGFLGIFENEDQFEYFKTFNCGQCKKKPEKCSILKKALQNRITDEIDLELMKCNVIKKK